MSLSIEYSKNDFLSNFCILKRYTKKATDSRSFERGTYFSLRGITSNVIAFALIFFGNLTYQVLPQVALGSAVILLSGGTLATLCIISDIREIFFYDKTKF